MVIDFSAWEKVGGAEYDDALKNLLEDEIGALFIKNICKYITMPRPQPEAAVIITEDGRVRSPAVIDCGLAEIYGYDIDKIREIIGETGPFEPGARVVRETDIALGKLKDSIEESLERLRWFNADAKDGPSEPELVGKYLNV